MAAVNPLTKALTRCETDLQKAAAEAMTRGDYETARLGMELAEGIASQRAQAGLDSDATPLVPASKIAAKPKGSVKRRQTKTKPVSKRTSNSSYPRFARDGDTLIKIGWSKRTRKEYQHKAPRSAVDAFIAHLLANTEADRIFKIDDLLPVRDPANDGDLPTYQIYLALAWLRDIGAADKHGRDGYSVTPSVLTEKRILKAWDQLSSHSII